MSIFKLHFHISAEIPVSWTSEWISVLTEPFLASAQLQKLSVAFVPGCIVGIHGSCIWCFALSVIPSVLCLPQCQLLLQEFNISRFHCAEAALQGLGHKTLFRCLQCEPWTLYSQTVLCVTAVLPYAVQHMAQLLQGISSIGADCCLYQGVPRICLAV